MLCENFKCQNYTRLTKSLPILLLRFNYFCCLTKFLLSYEKACSNPTLISGPQNQKVSFLTDYRYLNVRTPVY